MQRHSKNNNNHGLDKTGSSSSLRPMSKKGKVFALVLFAPAAIASTIGVGFSSWAIGSGASATIMNAILGDGDFGHNDQYVDCFSKPTMDSVFTFCSKGVLAETGAYDKTASGELTGSCAFSPQDLFRLNVIPTLSDTLAESSIRIVVYLHGTISLNGVLLGQTSTMSWAGNTIGSSGVESGEDIAYSFAVTNVDVSADTPFSFSLFVQAVSEEAFDSFYTNFSSTGSGFSVSLRCFSNE